MDRPTLRIIDDEALKFLLTLSNQTKIPTLLCGTPDGISAFGTRMSTSQRLCTGGHHVMDRAQSPDDPFFSGLFFSQLCKYQWTAERLAPSVELRETLYQLSAGVLRICMALWVHAQRRTLARGGDQLTIADLQYASEHPLVLVRPAVHALLSGDPVQQRRYEDLLPTGPW